MTFRAEQVRQAIQGFDFSRLFVEELGWDNPPGPQSVPVDDRSYDLEAVAEKSGLVAYVHRAAELPPRATRMKIERQLTKAVYEHLIVFVDAAQTRQVWQWVRRQAGQTPRYREHAFRKGQSGEPLVQKLQPLAFSFDEEPATADVTGRARKAFDVDRVTRRFYDKFNAEHRAFQEFLEAAISSEKEREVYTSVMLDRLMFVYFIQKKGFLDDDRDYLRTRLKAVQKLRGQGQFLSFYRHFLRRFFHEGLGQPSHDRDHQLADLIGDVPYLNGGIFDVHAIEDRYRDIQIDDLAFVRLFDFFDAYDWHLDERPLRNDREINPDVLGYIFEKYVNQKQMGAYYTKEDITGYITQNTVIPRLFDMARRDCAIAFRPDSALWRLLSENPDRYIYRSVRKGVDQPLPEDVAVGQVDVSRRGGWNAPADEAYALPTETWREHVARRQRHDQIWEKLVDGEVHRIEDFITLNLDMRQFAQDVIRYSEGPELLRAFWKAIRNISVLDPACGSGAFLFAALDVLESLYDACLERMEAFVGELDDSVSTHGPAKFSDFKKHLDLVASHPNRRYYILKSIVIGNLYGVDIMEEAVEICKLRLFLKLAAQADNLDELEPLPDIDFNIRSGNTLVGFTSLSTVRRAMTVEPNGQHRQLFDEEQEILDRIEEQAELASRAFDQFRKQQIELGGDITAAHKADLRHRLTGLSNELDRYLATEYGINLDSNSTYDAWRVSHDPFHWFVEFYGIMQKGGFDVVIGNPPYVEYSKVRKAYKINGFATERCGNLYAYFMERSKELTNPFSMLSMIVPLSGHSTRRMMPLVDHFYQQFASCYLVNLSGDANPSRLFPGVKFRLAIFIASNLGRGMYTPGYTHWYSVERELLFSLIRFTDIQDLRYETAIPKVSCQMHRQVLKKLNVTGHRLTNLTVDQQDADNSLLYHSAPVNWIRAHTTTPYFQSERDGQKTSVKLKELRPGTGLVRDLHSILCSTTFFIWWISHSDCYDLNRAEIESFPCAHIASMDSLSCELEDHMQSNTKRRVYNYRTTGRVEYDEFYMKLSKPVIDEIDRVLATHFGFTDEELDFIINYDIKYRMGRSA